MKKVLFATTALVATAGIAAADVTLSGSAEMGLFGGDEYDPAAANGIGDVETQFFTDIDVTFTMSGETDNGLTFGASVDLDEGGDNSNAVDNNADDGGATIFLSGNFGTVTMGDTDGALDWALTEAWVGNAGSIADDETSHAGALGAYGDGAYDGQILRYDYSVGDFGVAVSVEMDDSGTQDNGYALGFRYGFDFAGGSVDLGAGYQTFTTTDGTYLPGNLDVNIADGPTGLATGDGIGGTTDGDGVESISPIAAGTDVDIIGLSAAVELDSGLSAGIQYSDWDFAGVGATHVGIGAGYTFDAFTVSANWGQYDIDGLGKISGYGLAAAYDLGGGASVHFGYGVSDYSDVFAAQDDIATWSLGVAMSF